MLGESVNAIPETARGYDLQDRMIDFAVRILKLAESLPETRAGRHVAGQLIRSGTSPAPNYGEAQSAESRKDFVHKLKVALKELRETHVWLLIIRPKPLHEPPEHVDPLIQECNELIAILVTSIGTAQHNMGHEKPRAEQTQRSSVNTYPKPSE